MKKKRVNRNSLFVVFILLSLIVFSTCFLINNKKLFGSIIQSKRANDGTTGDTNGWEISTVFYDETVDNGLTPLTEINWDASDGGKGESPIKNIIVQINYKNTNAVTDYDVGEVQITIPRIVKVPITNLDSENTLIAKTITVGANDASHTGYDWNYTYNNATNLYTFTNAIPFSANTNFEGTIQMVYSLQSRKWDQSYDKVDDVQQINNTSEFFVDKTAVAILNDTLESNPIHLHYYRLYVHNWTYQTIHANKNTEKIKSYDVPYKMTNDVEDYYWIKYKFTTETNIYIKPDYPVVGLQTIRFVDQFPEDTLVYCLKTKEQVPLTNGRMDYTLDFESNQYTTTSSPFFIVGYKKSTIGGNTTFSNTVQVYGKYNGSDEEVYFGEKTVSVNLLNFIYSYTDSLYSLQQINYNNDTALFYRYLINKNYNHDCNYDFQGHIVNKKFNDVSLNVIYTGQEMSVEFGEDLFYVSDVNGGYHRITEDEYKITYLRIPSFYDGEGEVFKTSIDIYIKLRGEQDYQFYKTVQSSDNYENFPSNMNVVAYYYKIRVDNSIKLDTNKYVSTIRFNLDDTIPEEGSIHSFHYLKVYNIDNDDNYTLANTVDASSYDGFVNSEEIVNYDLDEHGSYIQRASSYREYDNGELEFDNPYYYSNAAFGNFVQNAEEERFDVNLAISGEMDGDSYFYQLDNDYLQATAGENLFNNWGKSIYYVILPEGMKLNSTVEEIRNSANVISYNTSFVNSQNQKILTSKSQQKNFIKSHTTVDIEKNYRNSNRTKITITFDFTDDDVMLLDDSFEMSYIVKTTLSYDDYLEYGNVWGIYSYSQFFGKNGDVLYCSPYLTVARTYNHNIIDNGSKEELAYDINNNGDTTEYLLYTYNEKTVNSVISTHQDLQVSARSELDAYDTKLVEAPLDSTYTYKLSARTGENAVTNLVIYDSIEKFAKNANQEYIPANGVEESWNGSFLGVDTSYAESKGYNVRVWYSEFDQPGPLSNDYSWNEYNEYVDKNLVRSLAFEYLDEHGNPAIIPANSLTYVVVNMKSPSEYMSGYAYNGIWSEWNAIDPITEQPVDYITGINSNIVKVELLQPVVPATDITLTKVWNDNSDELNVRPSHVTFIAIPNGDESEAQEITFTGTGDTWTYDVSLPKYDEFGELIEYTINEETIIINDNYKYVPTIEGYTVTNTLYKKIKITKNWKDNSNFDSKRPSGVTIDVMQNDLFYESVTITGSFTTNTWTKNEYVPVFDDSGNEYTYSLDEEEVENYEETCNDFTCDNVLSEDIKISVTKVWQDDSNSNNSRPNSVSVTLKRNGTYYKTINIYTNSTDTWTSDEETVPKYDGNGEKYTYTIEEDSIDGYEVLDYDQEDFTVTNKIKDATLVVRYVDQAGNNIDPTKNRNEAVHWGDTYTSSQLTFTNYNFVNITGDSASGTISKDYVEIIYHYQIKDATLTIKYVDQDGNSIDPTKDTINAPKHWGDAYASTQLIFGNYNFVNVTGDAPSGVISKDHVEVIYHYSLKTANLVVKYVDQDGNDIDPTKNRNESVHWGDSYTSEQLTFTNYNFVERTGDPASGTISKNNVEVIYHYQLKSATLVVKYVDEDGNNIDPSVNRNEAVHYGDSYASSQLTFTNYNFVEVTGDDPSGVIGKDLIEVIYHYELCEAVLSVRYVDQDGYDIDITKNRNESVHYGDSYTSTQLTFTNYNYVEQTGDAPSGTINKDLVEIIYHYTLKDATLTIKYVDQDGNSIDPTKDTINAPKHWGDTYSSQQLTFTNYNFVNRTGDAPNGTIAQDNVEVIYHYALKDATLTIKYVDQDGNDIDPTKNRNEAVHWGDAYASTQIVFGNYNFVERTGDPGSGIIAKDHVEVIYHYELKDATLTIRYVDEKGNSIDPTKDTINAPKHWGDSYTSQQLTFTNYNFVEQTGDNPSDTIAKDNVEVIYHYQIKDATLTIKYVDQDGNSIDPTKDTVNAPKHWGDAYASSQLTFTNYNFVEQTGDAPSGTINKDLVEIIYHYTLKDATLTIKYVDQDGNSIDPTKDTINAPMHWGDAYASTQIVFGNYNFVEQTGDAPSGVISKDHVEVVYHYQLKSATLVVKYVDQDGNDIDESKNRNEAVHWGDSYTSEQLIFTNYNLVERTGDPASGTISKDLVEVIYHYQIKDATLTIKYVDQDGNSIDPTKDTINAPKHWGDNYSSAQLTFTNYNFINRTGDAASGTIAQDHVEVVYHYAIKNSTLTIRYVDQDGNDIDPSVNTINAPKHWGDAYASTQLIFGNYNFVEQTGDAPSGIIGKNHVEVIYHYQIKDATLVVKYVDEDGNDIDPTKNRNEAVHWGDSYASSQLTFTNYNFVEVTGDAPSGTIAKDYIEIIYHYELCEAVLSVRYVDQDGYDIDITKNRNEAVHFGDTYSSEPLTFTNYNYVNRTGDPASGTIGKDLVEVIYHYQIKDATLTIKYVDQDGNDIDPSVNTINAPKHWGDTYTSSQLTFTNYNFVERTGDPASGTIAKDHVEVIYHYQVKSATLVVRYVDENGNDIDSTKNRNESVHWGDTYTSSQLTFTNYNFVNITGDSASGTIAKDNVEIIYHYQIKDATLTIKYVDQDGNDIDPSVNTINVPKHWGDAYASTQAVFGNYNFVEVTGDAPSGVISKDHVEVVYHYQIKGTTLVVKYVDQDGNDIDPTKNRNESVHWGDSYTSEQLTFTNYNFVERTGDPASGTINKDNVEVIYHYQLKSATLVVKYVDENGHNIDITENINEPKHWGDNYTTVQKTFTNYNFVRTEGDATSGTIAKDQIEVHYVYTLKDATLTIKYVDQDGNDIDPTKNIIESKHWGDTYTSEQLTFANYNFLKTEGDPTSGTITKNNVEVRYIYTLRPSVITAHHFIDGTTTKIAEDVTQNKKYTESYTTTNLNTTNLDYEYVRTDGDPETGTVSKDTYDVNYYYQLKQATVITHHYLYQSGETTTKLAPDVEKTWNYTETYTTSTSDEVPDNYELFKKSDNFTGIVNSPTIEVSYYYQLKDSNLVTSITKTGPDEITTKDEEVNYKITYNASLKDYIGNGTITIIDTLPYKIDVAKSDLAGGTYDEISKTITWIEEWQDIDSYNSSNETATKEIEKDLKIVYIGIVGRDRVMVNNTLGRIELSNNSRDIETSKSTNIRIKGNIKVMYLDKDTNEEIFETIDKNELVGETFVSSAKTKDGYILVEKPDTEEYYFEEENQTFKYLYEHIKFEVRGIVLGSGGGNISGDEDVYWGGNSTENKIVIEAEKGYVIDSVYINGVKQDIDSLQEKIILHNFENVLENKKIEVSFVKGPVKENPPTGATISILLIFFGLFLSIILFIKGKSLNKLPSI